jgi:hypothetical protein
VKWKKKHAALKKNNDGLRNKQRKWVVAEATLKREAEALQQEEEKVRVWCCVVCVVCGVCGVCGVFCVVCVVYFVWCILCGGVVWCVWCTLCGVCGVFCVVVTLNLCIIYFGIFGRFFADLLGEGCFFLLVSFFLFRFFLIW